MEEKSAKHESPSAQNVQSRNSARTHSKRHETRAMTLASTVFFVVAFKNGDYEK
jgi:hypothetical protein